MEVVFEATGKSLPSPTWFASIGVSAVDHTIFRNFWLGRPDFPEPPKLDKHDINVNDKDFNDIVAALRGRNWT